MFSCPAILWSTPIISPVLFNVCTDDNYAVMAVLMLPIPLKELSLSCTQQRHQDNSSASVRYIAISRYWHHCCLLFTAHRKRQHCQVAYRRRRRCTIRWCEHWRHGRQSSSKLCDPLSTAATVDEFVQSSTSSHHALRGLPIPPVSFAISVGLMMLFSRQYNVFYAIKSSVMRARLFTVDSLGNEEKQCTAVIVHDVDQDCTR